MGKSTDFDIAKNVLGLAKKHKSGNPLEELESYAKSASAWFDRGRIRHIRKLIGQIGGAASKRRAVLRAKRKKIELEKARQYRLFD